MVQATGLTDHAPSRPLVIVSPALPVPHLFSQPKTLLLDAGGGGLGTQAVGLHGAVGLAERVPAGDQRDGLLVVHRHAAERVADVLGCRERIRIAVRPLRIDVDQAHLNRGERVPSSFRSPL